MKSNNGLSLPAPRIAPPLDPNFRPAVLAFRAFQDSAARSGAPQPVLLGLEQADGSLSRFETTIHPAGVPGSEGNYVFLERLIKFLLWSRGGYRIYFAGPKALGEKLQAHYQTTATGKFDAWIMGEKIYERPFEVRIVAPSEMPPQRESSAPLGRHLEGCRIGFDLGASDRKVAAVMDGETVFSEEVPWDPRSQSDPQWHFDQIMDSLKRAAAHMPRVDAIGGSSAGAYVNNRVKVASLFRGVPDELFNQRIKDLFLDIQRAWNNVPLEIVNDGEVTALAGSMSLGVNAVLGIALGSSQAAGYVNAEGNITSWLNELAFVPVDYDPGAATDEWSGDYGCGVQYFSQQAVGRLAPASGLDLDFKLPLPELLVEVQARMAAGDERAARIYDSIGVYLGYTAAHYTQFYDFEHLLVLGRVTSGEGGRIIIDRAREVLAGEFPELTICLHTPDEKQKRHGQAMAAASLPSLSEARR
jgi:predicted NBD/HSP70 family sugar kinase